SEIFIDDILKKSLIFKEKRLDLIGRNNNERKKVSKTGKSVMGKNADQTGYDEGIARAELFYKFKQFANTRREHYRKYSV
ncbi:MULTISPECIES: hypothetical protein, partial [unclassified Ruminococcus]|uniref:hypothetical protein n=1 Tax=unclassified Ruminococcus TaxID=2608920 RepID=UPI00319E8D26